MEKVICAKCGSIGYSASPDRVGCYECGERRYVAYSKRRDFKAAKRFIKGDR